MIVKEIAKTVEAACKQPANYFGYEIWSHHILPAAKYSKLMAKKLGANEEIVEIASLLHDYASVKDYKLYEDHHIHGAKLAEEILQKYNCPVGKIEQVKNCIPSHRGSKAAQKLTKEAICVRDGDSMAHFDSISALFYLAFFSHKMNLNEANEWLMQKLERSWNKLSPKAKKVIRDKYVASKILLKSQK